MGIKGPDGEADATQHRDEAALEDHGSRTQHGRLFPTPLTSLIHASSNAWRPAPSSCICLRWQSECIRVRVSGAVRRIDRTHGADPHFAHERGAKLWAWASRRSRHSCTPWPAKPVIVLWDLCAYRSAPVCTSVCVCVCGMDCDLGDHGLAQPLHRVGLVGELASLHLWCTQIVSGFMSVNGRSLRWGSHASCRQSCVRIGRARIITRLAGSS